MGSRGCFECRASPLREEAIAGDRGLVVVAVPEANTVAFESAVRTQQEEFMDAMWRTGLVALACVAASCRAEETSVFVQASPSAGGSTAGGRTAYEPGLISEMEVDDSHLYWAVFAQVEDTSTLWRMKRSGGSPELVASLPGRAYGIALDQTHLYFTQTFGQARQAGGSVSRIPKLGGPAEILAEGIWNPTSIALDADHVYYTSAVSPTGSVHRVAKEGGASRRIADGIDNPWDIAVDEESLYVSAMNQSQVLRLAKEGGFGFREVLASGTIPTWMNAQASQVYFGSCATGACEVATLQRVSGDGGEVESLLSTTRGHEGKVAATSEFVVWGGWLLSLDGGPPVDLLEGAPSDFYPMAAAADSDSVYLADETGTILVHAVER